MNDRLVSLLLATLLLTIGAAWVAQRMESPAPPPGERIQTVTTAPIQDEKLPANAATIRRESDGHFWTRAEVNGSSFNFLVDTGASVIALTRKDARRLRIDLDALVYDNRVTTAGGTVMSASILLETVRIGNVELENIEAIVMEEEDLLQDSLLGMSFLGKLYSYEFKGNTLIIRQ